MWPYVQSARAAGVGSTEIAVYEDPTSTATQIAEAQESLEEILLEVEGSEDSPADYSFLITNGDCASSSFSGWTTEGSWGSNTTFYHNGDALLTNRFTESWVSGGNTLTDRSISQTLTTLPEGNYQLSLDIVATQQGDASVVVTGATLFLGDQEIACSSANGVPETFTTPTLTVKEGETVTLGFKLESTTANWVAFDNFRLKYLGSPVGDINGYGKYNIVDVTALIEILLGNDAVKPYKYLHKAANVNKDTGINLSDMEGLKTIIMNQ